MQGNIANRRYLRGFLQEQVQAGIPMEDAKKACRKDVMDTLSRLPQMVYDQLLHCFPVPEMTQHLVAKAIFGKSKHIPWDKPHLLNIQNKLPPKERAWKDVRVMYDRIQKEYLKKLQPMLSNQIIRHIQKKIKDFLETRNRGIDMVYQHKDHPEHLLRKLLKEEQYREDEKELFEMKCYLNDNKAKLYIDRVYGVLYLFLAPALAKQYLPRGSGGNFLTRWMSNEPVISDQEAMKHYEEIMEKRENGKYDIRSVYSIIVGPSSATTRMHETQHFVNSLVMPEKNDQDFLERGKDEILAYVKTDVKIEDVIKVMHGEMYDYYQKEVNHISERIQRRKNFIKENKDNAPDHAIENSKKNLISNEKRLDDYQKTNLPLRNEYLSTIDGYIRMAYVFKDSGIENRMELLMLTPITQRPKLLEIYNVA